MAELFANVSLKDIPSILPMLTAPEQERLLAELDKLEELKKKKLAQEKELNNDLLELMGYKRMAK